MHFSKDEIPKGGSKSAHYLDMNTYQRLIRDI